MAAAAATAASVNYSEGLNIDYVAVEAAMAVHAVNPDEAPARAAEAAAKAGASGAVCTAIAAGVAAAAVGWESDVIRVVSREAFDTYRSNSDKYPAVVAEKVAEAVSTVSSRYPAVQAAAAAAYAHTSTDDDVDVDGAATAAADGAVDAAAVVAAGGGAAGTATDGAADAAVLAAVDVAVDDAGATAADGDADDAAAIVVAGGAVDAAAVDAAGRAADGAASATVDSAADASSIVVAGGAVDGTVIPAADGAVGGAAIAAAGSAADAVPDAGDDVDGPAMGAARGGAVDAAAIVAAGAAADAAAIVTANGDVDAAAIDAAVGAADGPTNAAIDSADAAAIVATDGEVDGAVDGGAIYSAPADGAVGYGAIAAANAAGQAVKAIGGPDIISDAAAAAAEAATARGASRRSVVEAAVAAAAPVDASPAYMDQSADQIEAQRADHIDAAVAVADALAPTDSPVQYYVRGRGGEKLEDLPDDHKRVYQRLETIMTLDTFLAGFLLTSLTGKLEEEGSSSTEVAQIFLETLSFGVLLAATVYSGTLMVVTGGKYALSNGDLIAPIGLSILGLVLVLATVGHSICLALGLTSYNTGNTWLYVPIVIILLAPAYAAGIVAVTTVMHKDEPSEKK